MEANCYVVADSDNTAIIIDPGDIGEYISEIIEREQLKPKQIIATHGHFDHIMAGFFLQKTYNIPFLLHKDDAFLVSRMAETAKHFLGVTIVDPEPTIDGTIELNTPVTVGKIKLSV